MSDFNETMRKEAALNEQHALNKRLTAIEQKLDRLVGLMEKPVKTVPAKKKAEAA